MTVKYLSSVRLNLSDVKKYNDLPETEGRHTETPIWTPQDTGSSKHTPTGGGSRA